MTMLQTGPSYWMESAPGPGYPTLPPGSAPRVDVAVVGGGIAGLCAAWELARAGRTVAVLEAGQIAGGVTGFTTAKLSSLHTLAYARLRADHGPKAARWYAESQQDAVEQVARVAGELGVDCELERVPAYTYVESAERVQAVRDEAEAAREAGLPASFTTVTDLPFPVAAAVRVEDQAQFHPRRYLLALAEDLLAHGGTVYEHTRVTGLHEGEPCRLTTESGAVLQARDVIVATHYPVFDRALLFTRLEPHRELVVAARLAAERTPQGLYITPEQHIRSVRSAPLPDGQRLLIVTGEQFRPGAGDVGERFRRLTEWALEHFPDAQLTHRWAAQDNHSTDHVPFVGPFHARARHVYVAAGFGGWGMSGGVMSGRLLASHLTGEKLPWADLYDPRRLHPVREGPSLLRLQTAVARHFVGDRLRTSGPSSVDEIAPGTGAVVRSGAQHCAVYRDEDGTAHAVSARCSHLGCLVRFNDAERTWECPCHGSRFAVDGSVLQGPAIRSLPRRPVPGTKGPHGPERSSGSEESPDGGHVQEGGKRDEADGGGR